MRRWLGEKGVGVGWGGGRTDGHGHVSDDDLAVGPEDLVVVVVLVGQAAEQAGGGARGLQAAQAVLQQGAAKADGPAGKRGRGVRQGWEREGLEREWSGVDTWCSRVGASSRARGP